MDLWTFPCATDSAWSPRNVTSKDAPSSAPKPVPMRANERVRARLRPCKLAPKRTWAVWLDRVEKGHSELALCDCARLWFAR